MATVKVTKEDFKDQIANGYTLVDFWAEWCGPCKMVEPFLEELSEEWGDKVTIAKLDVDENNEVSQEFGVQSIPTMILFKDGEVVERQIGALPKAAIKQFVEGNMENPD